ncbi:hypothetical protein P5640_26190 [Bacillus subtilis]
MLLKHFGSVKKMKEASLEDIKKAGVPTAAAQLLYDKLQK